MPERFLHGCATVGCPALTRDGPRCDRCRRKRQRTEARGRRERRTGRNPYDRRWRKVRALHLAIEPLCRSHRERGFIVAANEVDHIDGDPFNNHETNLRSLCKPCHSRRTARDQGFGRARGT